MSLLDGPIHLDVFADVVDPADLAFAEWLLATQIARTPLEGDSGTLTGHDGTGTSEARWCRKGNGEPVVSGVGNRAG